MPGILSLNLLNLSLYYIITKMFYAIQKIAVLICLLCVCLFDIQMQTNIFRTKLFYSNMMQQKTKIVVHHTIKINPVLDGYTT